MASTSIPCLLFLSLLCHSMILTKCEVDEGELLKDMNEYRKLNNLTALNRTESADCVAKGIVGMLMNQTCTNTSIVPNNTTLSNYSIPAAKCGLNASGDSLVLAACGPALVASNISTTYAASLNAVRFPTVGIDSHGNWTVVVLLANATLGVVNGASAALAFTTITHVYLVFSFLCFLVFV